MSLSRVFVIHNNIFFKGVLGESIFKACSRTAGSAAGGKTQDKKPLRKAKTPLGRFDIPEQETPKDVLERFPDGVNPATKEKEDPRAQSPLDTAIGRERGAA